MPGETGSRWDWICAYRGAVYLLFLANLVFLALLLIPLVASGALTESSRILLYVDLGISGVTATVSGFVYRRCATRRA